MQTKSLELTCGAGHSGFRGTFARGSAGSSVLLRWISTMNAILVSFVGVLATASVLVVGYHFENGKVSYAVFLGPVHTNHLKLPVQTGGDSRGGRRAALHLPNAEPINLIGTRKLYQIQGNTVTETSEAVTETEFLSYMESKPSSYTVESLLEFLRTRRAKK